MKCFSLLLLAVGAFASDDLANPVGKVIHLLEDLKGKIEKDGAQDTEDFEKYKCWCDTVDEKKAADIKEAEAEIKRLESEGGEGDEEKTGPIPAAKSKIKTLENDLMLNGEAIEDQEKSIRESQNNRNKQHTKNMAEHANNMEMMASEMEGASIISGGAFSEDKKLVKHGESFVQMLTKRSHLRKSKYTPASKAITGILASQYETLATDEELMQRDEAHQASEFHDLHTTQLSQLAVLTKTKNDKTEEKVNTKDQLAADTKLLEATKEQLKADQTFLARAKDSCANATADMTLRESMRQKELDGVNKALEILESKRELFAKTFKSTPGSFLQLSAKSSSAEEASQAAYAALKEKISLTHSIRLANIAAEVQEALPTGAFTEVLAKIEGVLGKIKTESEEDIAKKDDCTEEYHTNSMDHKKQVFLIQKSSDKIDKIQAHLDELAADKAESEAEIGEIEGSMAKAKELRLKQHADFKQSKADDELAITTLGEVRDALSKFYDENTGGAEVEASLAAEPMDDDDKAALLLKDDPSKFAESRKNLKNSEHKFTLSGKDGQKDTATGVLSMIDRVVENLNTEIKDDLEMEAKTQTDYDEVKKDQTESKSKLEQKVADIDEIISDETDEKATADGKMEADDKTKTSLETEKASIKEGCDFILEHFDDRVAKRQSERDGILRAKELLSGASFVQQSAQPVPQEEAPQEASEPAPELEEGSSLMNYLR